MKYRVAQRVHIVQTYIRKTAHKKCCSSVSSQFPGVLIPSRSTTHELIKKYELGSLLQHYLLALHISMYFFIQSQKSKPTEYIVFREKPATVYY
jgi:hypothetical protein